MQPQAPQECCSECPMPLDNAKKEGDSIMSQIYSLQCPVPRTENWLRWNIHSKVLLRKTTAPGSVFPHSLWKRKRLEGHCLNRWLAWNAWGPGSQHQEGKKGCIERGWEGLGVLTWIGHRKQGHGNYSASYQNTGSKSTSKMKRQISAACDLSSGVKYMAYICDPWVIVFNRYFLFNWLVVIAHNLQ